MRPSSRTAILEAALRVVRRAGVTGLTLDAVAVEAGLSKGGLIYHFATKEALLLAVMEHITGSWERAMLDELATPFAEAAPGERVRAYIRVCADRPATDAELAMLIDAMRDEDLMAPWRELLDRWTGDAPANVDRTVARLAADGLWLAEATGTAGPPPTVREAVLERIIALAADDPVRPTADAPEQPTADAPVQPTKDAEDAGRRAGGPR